MMIKRISGSGVQGSVICSGMPVDKVAVRLGALAIEARVGLQTSSDGSEGTG
jgi:hypothetical protein